MSSIAATLIFAYGEFAEVGSSLRTPGRGARGFPGTP